MQATATTQPFAVVTAPKARLFSWAGAGRKVEGGAGRGGGGPEGRKNSASAAPAWTGPSPSFLFLHSVWILYESRRLKVPIRCGGGALRTSNSRFIIPSFAERRRSKLKWWWAGAFSFFFLRVLTGAGECGTDLHRKLMPAGHEHTFLNSQCCCSVNFYFHSIRTSH